MAEVAAASIYAFVGGILGGAIGVNHIAPAFTPPPRVLVIHSGPSGTRRIVEGLLVGICVALMTCLLVAPDHFKALFATVGAHLRAAHAKLSAYSNDTAMPHLQHTAAAIGMKLSRVVQAARESVGKMIGNKKEQGGGQRLEPVPKLESAPQDGWVMI
ncbi:hypothetical protein BST61_g11497 [Cercospora zeina]